MTHVRQRLGATAATALAVTTVLLGAGAGHAAPPAEVDCAAIVVDNAGVVDERRVQRAAQPVIDQAADVRVVAFASVPGGDLDEAVTKLQRSCGLWSAEDGTLNDNMIVLAVSVQDRRSGLYYGASWSEQLLSSWPRIQARAMNPAFKEGDWTGGMVAGLRAVDRRIEAEWMDPGDDLSGDDLSGDTDEIPYAESPNGSYGMTGMGESSGSGGMVAILGVGVAALAIAGVALGGGGGRLRAGGRGWRGGTATGTSSGFAAGLLAGRMSHHQHHHHHHSGPTGGSGHGGSSGGRDGGGSSSF